MSILTRLVENMKVKRTLRSVWKTALIVSMLPVIMFSCKLPDQDIVLRNVRDVVADANTDPMLKAEAVFYNPNNVGGKLRHINVDIYVNGKKAGTVEKDYRIKIPAKGEFSVPLEVKLNMKELGTVQTLLGLIGGKKFDIEYQGKLGLTYHGLPMKVPVKYKSQIRVSF
jgi:LEA14-like dessication related protein